MGPKCVRRELVWAFYPGLPDGQGRIPQQKENGVVRAEVDVGRWGESLRDWVGRGIAHVERNVLRYFQWIIL